MSMMSELHLNIQDEIELGELTFRQIAVKYGVHYDEVDLISQEMADQVEYDDDGDYWREDEYDFDDRSYADYD